MSARKLIAVAASVVSVGGAALGLLPASAQSAAVVSCTFQGTTTQLTPIPAAPAMNTAGTYQFAGGPEAAGSCTAVDNGTQYTDTAITSSGTYTNTVCGTGVATGTADATDGVNHLSIAYTINFVSGVGTLNGTATFPNGDTATIAGPVQITPVPTTGCAVGGVTKFTVTGSVHGAGA